jgi:small subunit ribosomal protein S7
MSRRSVAQKRPVPPDSVYNSRLITMMSRRLMTSGKKSLTDKIVYNSLEVIRERTGGEPLDVFEQAVRNTTPLVEVKARRVGERPIRCLWKSVLSEVQLWRCAG